MAAPADGSTTTTTVGQDEAVVKTTMPLPRAIQLVMAMSSRWKYSTTTTASMTIGEFGEHGVGRVFLWMKLVFVPSVLIVLAAVSTYTILSDDDDGGELISGPGGFGFLAVPILLCVYQAVVHAAGGHLGLSAPQTPYAVWEILHKVGYEEMGLAVMLISLGVWVLNERLNQAWPLLVAWTYLLGLLVASTVAFWLCLLRTYGGDGGGEGRRENSGCGEAVIDGLAYPFSRLLYEFVVRFHAVADAGVMQQLDADAAVV
ncbi:unnamed protein product [Miscanthus lutarioriparius]|uniref:DUF7378 domain-containing protein n=1 Tax=Miscanthus lutarioriparius TaxID=422564 RepID=A0A811NH67_9POAL|nr:unnamed protein product [Miscanthus lutarioriparius]